MSKDRPNNIYDRHQNKRALAKKERAKARHFSGENSCEESHGTIVSWESINEIFERKSEVIGTVVEVRSSIFYVLYGEDIFRCKLDQKIPFQLGRSLVVGDKVYFEIEDNSGIIKSRLERENYISRIRRDNTRFSSYQKDEQVVATNIDVGVIVATTMNPAFHANLIDRYLIIMQNGGVNPLICLNKCDLTNERDSILNYYRNELGINVIEISATTGEGMLNLQDALRGRLTVLLGNSGVGKTSIINALNKDFQLKTKTVSAKHKEGRHTTTTTTLHTWQADSHIIDTPGTRSLEIDNIHKEELKFFFPEFEQYEADCKYNDCTHDHEPEDSCGVKKAVACGNINQGRYESYLRMLKDLV
ncbi:MAG: ribosome small subunit-dependent GTPase A [Candidatus Gracilibacteria bacterium]|nr:ribosome small subunit-dependent GTPase A [Candidatus Gracilibacteria bacterium]